MVGRPPRARGQPGDPGDERAGVPGEQLADPGLPEASQLGETPEAGRGTHSRPVLAALGDDRPVVRGEGRDADLGRDGFADVGRPLRTVEKETPLVDVDGNARIFDDWQCRVSSTL